MINEIKKLSSPEGILLYTSSNYYRKFLADSLYGTKMAKQLIEILVILGKQ